MFTLGNREALAMWESERQVDRNRQSEAICRVCALPKDSINPWVFQQQTIVHMQDGTASGCQTCRFGLDAVRQFSSDPETRITFQDSPRRLTFDRRQFFEIFRVRGKYVSFQTGPCPASAVEASLPGVIMRLINYFIKTRMRTQTCLRISNLVAAFLGTPRRRKHLRQSTSGSKTVQAHTVDVQPARCRTCQNGYCTWAQAGWCYARASSQVDR